MLLAFDIRAAQCDMVGPCTSAKECKICHRAHSRLSLTKLHTTQLNERIVAAVWEVEGYSSGVV
jgi:hypothetical protein